MEEDKKNASASRNNPAISAGMAVVNSKQSSKNSSGSNMDNLNITEDYLVTYREFIQALRSLKTTLYKKLLPRTISF